MKEIYDDDDPQTTDEQVEERYQIESVSPTKIKESSNSRIYEEFVVPQTRKQVQYIFVKSKAKPVAEPVAKLLVSPTVGTSRLIESPEIIVNDCKNAEYITEDNISSTNIEEHRSDDTEHSTQSVVAKHSESLESYSEFIFNGEKYVQMPKRVYEAEIEKAKKESERYKLLLRKIKTQLNKMDLD